MFESLSPELFVALVVAAGAFGLVLVAIWAGGHE